MIGPKTTVHGNGTKWLLLGGCSCFFLCLCREQKVISRRDSVCGEGDGEEMWLAFYANDEGCAVAQSGDCCTVDGGEVTNYSSLSAALVFKGVRIPAQESSGVERRARTPRNFSSVYPSYKPAATMLTTSFRHVVEDISRPKLKITLPSPPKSLWSIHSVWLLHLLSPTIVFWWKKITEFRVSFISQKSSSWFLFYACE